MASMNLLTTITSPYGRVTRIALSELGLEDEYELTIAKTRTPQNETTRYNPTGKVPTLLIADGPVLSEVRLICYYLQRLVGRADFVSATDDIDAHVIEGVVIGFIDGVSVWLREIKRPENDQSQDILQQERERTVRCIQWFDERVAELPTTVNFCSASLLVALDTLDRIEPDSWHKGAPGLASWVEKLRLHPSIKNTT